MYYGVDSDEDAAKVGDEFADSYAELEPVFGGKEYIEITSTIQKTEI